MIKQTDDNIPAGEYLCLYYSKEDVVEMYFRGTLEELKAYPVQGVSYGLYHETHCPDSTVVNRLITAVYHDISKCMRNHKCDEDFADKSRLFMQSWMHDKNQKKTLLILKDLVELTPLDGVVKTHILNMCDFFDTTGIFWITETL